MAAQPNQFHQRRFTQQIDRGLKGGIINGFIVGQLKGKIIDDLFVSLIEGRPFIKRDDLLNIKGIDQELLKKIKPLVTTGREKPSELRK